MRRKSVEKVYSYTVLLEPAEEGGYTVTVPALPGCITEGDTLEEAREVIDEFIARYNREWLIERHGHRTPADVRQSFTRKAA